MAGGGKETPRAKMIGMMYLVLTALLAMNVSKQILQGYVKVNESIVRGRENLIENNKRVFQAFENTIAGNAGAKPYLERAKEAQKMLKEMEQYVDKVKFNIVTISEKLPPGGGDTLQLKYAKVLENYDDPSRILGVAEPSAPLTGSLTASELKDKLNKLAADLQGLLDKMQSGPSKLLKDDYESLKRKIAALKPIESGAEEDGIKMTWEVENFYHLPMAAVVCNLNKMAADLSNMEAEILNIFSGASGKLAIKFDNLKARVIAPSSYIQAGTQYTADIFIAASSSKLSKEDMKVIIGVDSAEAASGKAGGTELPIEGGEGKYLVGTSGQGEQTYKGVIKYKNPDGSFKYYPFSQTYMVAAPAVAVQLVKMNVMYIGVDNPIMVSAAGVSPTDLQVNISGCGATKTGSGGKFVVRATSPGTCMVSVSAKGKAQGPAIPIRVKKIPDPVSKVGGKTGNVDVKKVELGQIGGVGAELVGFDFDAKFAVISFELSAVVKGALKSISCTGNSVNSEARAILNSAGVGSKIFFENVKAKGPDGTIRNIPGVTLKVK